MYRIIYFRLEGHKALSTSTGRRVIEFDRRKSPINNNICIISGANGSGKTYLLSELTPFISELTATRKEGIYINDTANKIIHIQHDSVVYICEVDITPKKNTYKLYREKDGIRDEMNPDGGMHTYHAALVKHLGLNKNYTNVGFLSSGVQRVLDMTPAERTKYMTKWLPDIGELLEDYNNCRLKCNMLSRDLKYVDGELAKLDLSGLSDEDSLNASLTELKQEITVLQRQQAEGSTHIMYLNTEAAEFEIIENKFHSTISEIKRMKNDILSSAKRIQELDYDLDDKIKELQNKEEQSLRKNNQLDAQVQTLRARLQDTEAHIDRLGYKDEDNTISLEEINAEMSSLDSQLGNIVLDDIDDLHYNAERLRSYLRDRVRKINGITSQYGLSKSQLNDINGVISEIMVSIDGFRSTVDRASEKLHKIREEGKKLSLTHIDSDYFETLRRKACGDTCPVLTDLVDFVGSTSRIVLENEEEALRADEELQSARNALQEQESILRQLTEVRRVIGLLDGMWEDSISKVGRNKLTDIIRNKIEKSVSNSSDEGDEILDLSEKLVAHYSGCQRYLYLNGLKKEKLQRINYEKAFNELKAQRETLKNDIQNVVLDHNSNMEEYERVMDENKNVKELYEVRSRLSDIIDQYNDKVDSIEIIRAQLLRAKKSQLQSNIVRKAMLSIEQKIENKTMIHDKLAGERSNMIEKKNLSNTLENRKNALERDIKFAELLLEAWSPKSGLAALYINSFLEDLKESMNSILKRLWYGSLNIERFKTDDDGFHIDVSKDGTLIGDASKCSDGEQATLTCCFSLSLMSLNLKNKNSYNVLRLDEIDGVFDYKRRIKFVNILLDRLAEIKCDDCFIVTHNNEFDNIPVDFISLDNGIVASKENKNILFQ